MLTTLITFIIVLSVIIFVHELGHFWAARRFGIRVEEFGFGFPPRLASIERGGVRYSLNWIPFGGFVKMKGEDGQDRLSEDSFGHKPVWQRAIVLVAGVAMNVILAAVLLIVSFSVGIPSIVDESTTGMVREQRVQILEVRPDSPAAQANMAAGDIITAINGQPVDTIAAVQALIGPAADQTVRLALRRQDQLLEQAVTPRRTDQSDVAQIGVSLIATGRVSYPWYEAIGRGVAQTGRLIWEIIRGFGLLIRDLVVSRTVSLDVAGPVGIAVLTGQVADLGFIYLLQFIVLLSLTLAVINVAPFPALDGGRLFFVLIEKLRGRPLNRRVEGLIHGLGFYLLIALLVVISVRDFRRFEVGQKVSTFFQNLF